MMHQKHSYLPFPLLSHIFSQILSEVILFCFFCGKYVETVNVYYRLNCKILLDFLDKWEVRFCWVCHSVFRYKGTDRNSFASTFPV